MRLERGLVVWWFGGKDKIATQPRTYDVTSYGGIHVLLHSSSTGEYVQQ